MMAAVVSVTPARPVHGPDSGVAYAGPAARAASQRARAHTPRTLPLTPEGILHRAGGSGSSGSARRSASGTGPRSRPPKLPTLTPSPVTSNTPRVERRAQRLRHPLAEVDEALGVVWEPRCPTLRNEVDHLERGTALERTCAGVHLYGDRERGPRGARADCLSG